MLEIIKFWVCHAIVDLLFGLVVLIIVGVIGLIIILINRRT